MVDTDMALRSFVPVAFPVEAVRLLFMRLAFLTMRLVCYTTSLLHQSIARRRDRVQPRRSLDLRQRGRDPCVSLILKWTLCGITGVFFFAISHSFDRRRESSLFSPNSPDRQQDSRFNHPTRLRGLPPKSVKRSGLSSHS